MMDLCNNVIVQMVSSKEFNLGSGKNPIEKGFHLYKGSKGTFFVQVNDKCKYFEITMGKYSYNSQMYNSMFRYGNRIGLLNIV